MISYLSVEQIHVFSRIADQYIMTMGAVVKGSNAISFVFQWSQKAAQHPLGSSAGIGACSMSFY